MLVDLSLAQILLRILAMTVIFGVHGFVLAGLAHLLGDHGPRHDGRLSPNPFLHFSVAGLASGIASRAGWITYMRLDPGQMSLKRLGLVICVLASLGWLVAFSAMLVWLRAPVADLLDPDFGARVAIAMGVIAECSLWFAALNIIPIPPLTGGLLLAAIYPAAERRMVRHELWIGVALAALMFLSRGHWLAPIVASIRP